ncbi:MAG: hypothetical protein PHD15_05985 [Clostridia bacterium]|nr:hypothetical protein [Clostridia bacterium]MDD4387281.1 hypothetical protein [Clostridia bacterium]
MRVLEKGNPNGWEKEVTCTGKGNGDGGCNARLMVAEADIFVTASHCRDEVDYYYTFLCSECNTKTDIPERDIPSRVRTKAMDEYKGKNNR